MSNEKDNKNSNLKKLTNLAKNLPVKTILKNYVSNQAKNQGSSFKQSLINQIPVDIIGEKIRGKLAETKLNDETKLAIASKIEGAQVSLSNKAAKFAGVIALIVLIFLLFIFGFIWWICFKSQWAAGCKASGNAAAGIFNSIGNYANSFGNSAKSS